MTYEPPRLTELVKIDTFQTLVEKWERDLLTFPDATGDGALTLRLCIGELRSIISDSKRKQ